MEYPEYDLRIESEIQSIPIRISKMDGTQIGVALFVAGVVGQAVIKLLYIDSAERHRFKDIHRCMSKASEDWGFTERVHQRSKDGVFHTVVHKLKKT
tara:strand:+ start:563 stop:853 length:291 start_codon:yes stop_codon:yes gene_type:complete